MIIGGVVVCDDGIVCCNGKSVNPAGDGYEFMESKLSKAAFILNKVASICDNWYSNFVLNEGNMRQVLSAIVSCKELCGVVSVPFVTATYRRSIYNPPVNNMYAHVHNKDGELKFSFKISDSTLFIYSRETRGAVINLKDSSAKECVELVKLYGNLVGTTCVNNPEEYSISMPFHSIDIGVEDIETAVKVYLGDIVLEETPVPTALTHLKNLLTSSLVNGDSGELMESFALISKQIIDSNLTYTENAKAFLDVVCEVLSESTVANGTVSDDTSALDIFIATKGAEGYDGVLKLMTEDESVSLEGIYLGVLNAVISPKQEEVKINLELTISELDLINSFIYTNIHASEVKNSLRLKVRRALLNRNT